MLWEIRKFTKLHDDDTFKISTAALVEIQGAVDVGIPRPDLTYRDEDSRLVLKRYQGFGDAADSNSRIKLGVYQMLEKYYAPLRG